MGFDAILETIGEEVIGNLCGLPPGTLTAAKAAGLLAASSSTSSTNNTTSKTVKNNSRGLSQKEKKVAKIAVARLTQQIERDHRGIPRKVAVRSAMNVLVANERLYKSSVAKRNFLVALKGGRRERRAMMMKTLKDARRYL
ncbi:hypothetical protein ACAH01_08745 [Halomicrobium sp. HM KBTZ05]|uniref:hypothetical protein n=1 Tax=Halomicrobium sp. HM KBTZ05 TaxID=3242663 RepID=UPI003558EAF1